MNRMIIDGLAFALPLFIMAVGGIYSEQSGITNLALEGFQGVGAFTGALFVIMSADVLKPGSLPQILLAFAAAMAGGAVYSLLHALLCIRFRANMVISGIVINILAMAVTAYLTKQLNPLLTGAPSDKFQLGVSMRITIPVLSKIPVLGVVFKDLYLFEIWIVLLAVIAWFILYKSRFGLRLRACGDHPQAVDAAGVRVERIRIWAVLVSGALSGFAGMCFAYSISASFSSAIYAGYGYLAIAAMIFGNWKILPALGACLLFGFARSGGNEIVLLLQMPGAYADLVMILPYLLTLLLLVFFSGNNQAPRALGEVYEKGKR
ncbi:ABC transporter permease [Diplocloster agilis]|uniref:ABC transporter permease n=1 Tax=Diplocloster agilis TaxID=2850323 RepID=UPI0008219859|nr:ABC transporter permease [Suonthocola fibrivorans]MCU6733061.1 ABC transporter permease [Suonthocola fibrivorans]SCI74199.1 ribose ABC transporter permease protein [uncultured Clostridium sp.]